MGKRLKIGALARICRFHKDQVVTDFHADVTKLTYFLLRDYL